MPTEALRQVVRHTGGLMILAPPPILDDARPLYEESRPRTAKTIRCSCSAGQFQYADRQRTQNAQAAGGDVDSQRYSRAGPCDGETKRRNVVWHANTRAEHARIASAGRVEAALDWMSSLADSRAKMLSIYDDLNSHEPAAPSLAAGWSLRDVLAHLGSGCHAMSGPAVLSLMRSSDIEARNDSR